MTSKEKAELLKSTIYQLYSKEGRSISYISRLIEINRKTLSDKIKEWEFPDPEPIKYIKPSTQKFINKHKTLIKSRLDTDTSITDIANELNVDRTFLSRTIIRSDETLNKANNDRLNRIKENAEKRKQSIINNSARNYEKPIPGEKWKTIIGYSDYQVSNKGRIRRRSKKYDEWYILKPTPNKNNKRLYVRLIDNKGKSHNLQIARITAHAFVNGFSETHNTVNHKDGNPQNNISTNLEWVSQSENNAHAYRVLNRTKNRNKTKPFNKIIYKDKYEFKTVAAFAKFINKSETQTRRYIDEPEKHNIILVK